MEQFDRLIGIVKRLRAPDGCPWDREQTPETVKKYILEEAYELYDAIEADNHEEVAEELGDLLFMLIFLANIFEERGNWRFDQCLEKAAEKMIRRHPHIFGDVKLASSEEVLANWQVVKEAEAKEKGKKHSALGNLPRALPALQKAFRLGERASRIGFDWKCAEDVLAKAEEERNELLDAIHKKDAIGIANELGDLMFSLANFARHLGLNPEDVLRQTNERFIARFLRMEEYFSLKDISIRDASLEEMDDVWKIVASKQQESSRD